MDANLLLWVGQVLLALAFGTVSYTHSLGFETSRVRPGMEWLDAVGRDRMRVIAGFELLGALGLILPGLTGILPILTPIAALLLAVLMVLAGAFHLRRSGEVPNTVLNLVLGVMALAIAYGRFVVRPL